MTMPLAELLFGSAAEDGDRNGGEVLRSDAAIEALADRVRASDEVATEQLFLVCYAPLVRYARRFSGSLDAAEDLAQDALIQLITQLRSNGVHANAPRSVTALLRSIVRRRALNALRDARRASDTHAATRAANISPGTGAEIEPPDVAVERAEMIAAVRKVFDALPPRARLIATMRWSDGMGRQEIAAELGISVRTVDTQLYLALGRIRGSLEAFT